MPKTTASVMLGAITAITLIVLVGMALGHDSTLATGGISALSLVLGGTAIYSRERKKRG